MKITEHGTVAWAAEVIGVSQRQVRRLIAAGTLHACTPLKGSTESGRRHVVVRTDEVRAYAAARKVVTRG